MSKERLEKSERTPPVSWRPWALAYSRDRPYNFSCMSAVSKNRRLAVFFWALGCHLARKSLSRMSRVGRYGMTNADWLISRPAAQILPGLLRERVRMAKIKETERVRIQSLPAFFFVSRVTRDASACEKHFPPVIYGESGRRPPPRRFAPRGRTSPYSPEMTGGTYIS